MRFARNGRYYYSFYLDIETFGRTTIYVFADRDYTMASVILACGYSYEDAQRYCHTKFLEWKERLIGKEFLAKFVLERNNLQFDTIKKKPAVSEVMNE